VRWLASVLIGFILIRLDVNQNPFSEKTPDILNSIEGFYIMWSLGVKLWQIAEEGIE
jgi:hypothetical protein